MARVVRELPPSKSHGNQFVQKYPWDEWLNGQVWELEHGEDFTTKKVEGFVQNAYQIAKKRGVKVTIRVRGRLVYLQRLPRS